MSYSLPSFGSNHKEGYFCKKWGATAKMQKDVCQDQTSRYRSREMFRHRAKPYKVRGQLLRGRPKNRILLVTVVNIILQDHFLPETFRKDS